MALTAILALGGVVYIAASVFLWIGGLRRRARPRTPESARTNAHPFVTVIVAARNEAANIPALIDALSQQDYPADRWELYVVDDRSDDGTGDLVEQLLPTLPCRGRVLRQSVVPPNWSPKKHAITTAIQASDTEHDTSNRVVMTTDADCRPEPRWISGMIETLGDADLVAGYSPFGARTNVWRRMLALEAFSQGFLALAGIRLRWPITCTGRSFAYRRSVFDRAGGFGEARRMLSGDDHLFLQRAVGQGFTAVYCTAPNTFVWTDPVGSFRGFWHQRIRMFSGVGRLTPSVAIVGTAAYAWMLLLFGGMLVLWSPAWIGFIGKFVADAVSLVIAARHLREWRLLLVYPFAAFLYLPYFLTFAFLGTFGSYDWKGMRGR